jgi:uncharacterized protein (DUF362 family)
VGLLKRIQRHGLLVGVLSLGWLLLRSGSKPSRITYPCQQAAKANALAFLWVPVLAAVQPGDKKLDRRLLAAGLVLLLASAGAILLRQPEPSPGVTGAQVFPLTPYRAVNPASTVYAVNGYTGTNGGLARLIELMGENGAPFYESPTAGKSRGPAGFIAAGDVVIIKVNSQWSQRGGTNTDLLRELVALIQAHPDGFRGEIIVADNGQAQYGSAGRGGSLDWAESNAEDHAQSVQRVVDAAAGRVSTYQWDTITSTRVEEYPDARDGYVVEEGRDPETGLIVSYPKFTTKHGTMISFKHGVWDPESKTYDSGRLKVINLPVLKTHSGYGVTGAVKSYMGVPSDKLTASLGSRTHTAIAAGAMGTLMAETRFPALTILDCIWVNAVPRSGPGTGYAQATRVNVAAASLDPVALDVWASMNILMKAAPAGSDTSSMNPHSVAAGSFGDWLRRSAAELKAAGYPAELDEARVTVIVSSVA